MPLTAYGAGTVSQTDDEGRGFRTIQWNCTSSAAGAVSDTGGVALTGVVIGFSYDVGTSYPSDAFDVYLYDGNSVDILGGVGVDLPNGTDTSLAFATSYRTPLTTDGGYVILRGETITPVVANAGDSKTFTLYLHIK